MGVVDRRRKFRQNAAMKKSLVGALAVGFACSSFLAPISRADVLRTAGSPRIWVERPSGFFSLDRFSNGRNEAMIGPFGTSELMALVQSDPEALKLAEESDRKGDYALASYLAGLGSLVFSVYSSARGDSGAAWIGIAAAVPVLGLTIYWQGESRTLMYEAVNRFNGVAKPARTGVSSVEATLAPLAFANGAGAGAEIRF